MASIGLGGHVLHNVLLQVFGTNSRALNSLNSDQGSDVVMDYQERFLPCLGLEIAYYVDLLAVKDLEQKTQAGLNDSCGQFRHSYLYCISSFAITRY